MIRIGTRVINQYTMSPYCGMHGTVVPFDAGTKDWHRVFARIKYDNGEIGSEMKQYLSRE